MLVMEKFIVSGAEVEKTYEEYDSRFSNNGGDYYQPDFVCSLGSEKLCISDSSCGEFGTRVSVCLYRNGELVASAYYGSMLDPGQEYSEFRSFEHGRWLDISAKLGYAVPVSA